MQADFTAFYVRNVLVFIKTKAPKVFLSACNVFAFVGT
jgi:hypothetical protein